MTAAPVLPEAGKGGPAPLLIEVADTTRALQDGAREMRRRAGAKVVAITGSAGKTTTKELAAAFLAAKYSVFRNQGNLNNHIGLPLSLLELRTRPDVAVVELGMFRDYAERGRVFKQEVVRLREEFNGVREQ